MQRCSCHLHITKSGWRAATFKICGDCRRRSSSCNRHPKGGCMRLTIVANDFLWLLLLLAAAPAYRAPPNSGHRWGPGTSGSSGTSGPAWYSRGSGTLAVGLVWGGVLKFSQIWPTSRPAHCSPPGARARFSSGATADVLDKRGAHGSVWNWVLRVILGCGRPRALLGFTRGAR